MKSRIQSLSILIVCLILVAGIVLSACRILPSKINNSQKTLAMDTDFSYEIKEQQPFIHIDHIGYETKSKKLAFISGTDLEEYFELRDASTNHIVFKGKLRKIRSEKTNNVYMGDFSEYQENGKYYIHNPKVGDSREFEISNEIYPELFQYYFSLYQEKSNESISCRVYSLSNLLFTKELFPDTKIDDNFFQREIEELSKFLENQKELSFEEVAELAALMAQYDFIYGEKEVEFSEQCLKLAASAYIYLVNEKAELPIGTSKFLNYHMYRSTGQYQYRNKIKELDGIQLNGNRKSQHDYTLLSDFTYLSTEYVTDYEKCKKTLDFYMDWAQQISENSSRENFYVFKNADSIENSKVLDHLMVLAVVNYILSGREYEGIQENYIHYYLGGNPNNDNRLMNKEFLEQMECEDLSKLLFIMGSLCH